MVAVSCILLPQNTWIVRYHWADVHFFLAMLLGCTCHAAVMYLMMGLMSILRPHAWPVRHQGVDIFSIL